MKRVFIIGCILISRAWFNPSYAQVNNTFISDRMDLDEADTNSLGLSFQSFNYLRNTEYFNQIEVGRTLFGYQLHPSFYIQPNKHVKLQAGIWLRSDFGAGQAYTRVLPTFTLKIRSGNTSFSFGTLEGALSHRLVEPLFDINSAITKRIENGFQLKHVSDKTFFDLWINWEQFIERGSPFKEQFAAGINYMPTLYSNKSGASLSSLFQFTAFHRGGQIDTDTSNMLMVFNGAAGLEFSKFTKDAFFETVKLSVIRAFYHENTNSGYMPYRDGNGLMANLFMSIPIFDLMVSYWDGNRFIAPEGTTIYQSVSLDKPGYTEPNRKLLFVRLMYNQEIFTNLFLSARLEPFYDYHSGSTDYSYSLYLTYRQNFRLGRIRH